MKNDINHVTKILDTVSRGYIQAVYFTDTGEADQPDSDADVDERFNFIVLSDCAEFLNYCQHNGLLDEYAALPSATWDSFGIDFWLTRNGHGAGFWDRGYGELGGKLTDAAKNFGGRDTFNDYGLLSFD